MRTITTITDKNRAYFEGILPTKGTGIPKEVMQLGVIEDGAPAAACELLLRDGFCEINSFYVIENYRRKGVGSELLQTVLRLSEDNSILGIRADYEKDLGFADFFKKNGFLIMEGNPVYEVPLNALINTKWVRDALTAKEDPKLTTLKTALIKEKKSLDLFLRKFGYDANLQTGMDCDEDISLVYRNSYGAVCAVVLAIKNAQDVFVTQLISDSKNPSVVLKTLASMVANTFHWEKLPDHFCFFAEGKSIVAFLEKLVGKENIHSSVKTESAFLGLYTEEMNDDMGTSEE